MKVSTILDTRTTGSFVASATGGVLGTGDLAILAECELYAERTVNVNVRAWTHDDRSGCLCGLNPPTRGPASVARAARHP